MNSTSDLTEFRKIILNKDLLLRQSHSSIKKKPNLPKKCLPLAPLDFNEIKREIREAANIEELAEKNKCCISSEIDNNLELTSKGEDANPVDFKLVKDIWCSKEESKKSFEPLKNSLVITDNDSFDLDFSTLSLSTPTKQQRIPETPKEISTKHITTFDNFITPKVKSVLPAKIHCSVPRNSIVNNPPVKLINKPEREQNVGTNVVTTISRNILDDKTFNVLHVNKIEYVVLNLLGKGGSSYVYQCFCKERKKLVAIKYVSLANAASAQGYLNEVELLHKLQNCDRVIKLYDYEVLEEKKKLLMVIEKGGEDFNNVLKNLAGQKMNIPIYMLLFYWMEMLQAVKQIHSHGVIHADLKPSNFLWGDKGLKLIDFGISSTVQNDMTSAFKTLPEGSCNYMSPEALSNDSSSPGKSKYKLHYKSDVWSLGCILYQLVYKITPFHNIKQLWMKLSFITDPCHRIEYPKADWVPPKVIESMKKCLQHNVRLRPSVEELLEEYKQHMRNI